MKKILLLGITVLFSTVTFSQTARVQVVHNSADALLSEVDVYLNGTLAFDDFPFRNATEFMDVPSGFPAEVAVAPGNSTSVDDAVITETFVFESDETVIIIANGIANETGYDPSPPLSFDTFNMAKEVAENSENVEVLVHNGSTDSPAFDIVETGQELGTLIDDLAYPDFQGYIDLPTADYTINVTNADQSTTLKRYLASLQSSGSQGAALTVIASGFMDPSQNSDGPDFGLFATTVGGGPLLALEELPLSVTDVETANFTIYPNPVDTNLTLESTGRFKDITHITITDMQGRIIKTMELQENKHINVSFLSSGIYQIGLFEDNKKVSSKKFIKK